MESDRRDVEFAEISYDTWREAVGKDLATTLEDGIVSPALPTKALRDRVPGEGLPGAAPWIRGVSTSPLMEGWDLRQVIDLPDLDDAASQAKREVESGATSLTIRIGARGVPIGAATDLENVLREVPLSTCRIALDAGPQFAASAAMLEEVWRERGIADGDALGAFDADPIGALARDGALPMTLEEALDSLGALAARSAEMFPLSSSVLVSTSPYHEAGATAGQELAIALSTGVAYLRAMVAKGLSVDAASGQLALRLQVGPDVFWEMAKLRALRWLWGRVLQASGASEPKLIIQAATSERMVSPRDPWVNLLRTTTSAFAAAAAGAESVTVAPFDAPLGVPDQQGRRLARNIQHILIHEAQLHRVVDPGGGSYHLEVLTRQLGEKAWARFQELEREGGIAAALQRGSIQREIMDEAERRERLVATRRLPLTGVSEFPHLEEAPLVRPQRTSQGGAEGEAPPLSIEPLRPRRLGAPFEELRDASDAHLVKTGARPKAYLATLGKVAEHTARATWISNALASAGIDSVLGSGEGKAIGEAFSSSGAQIAVICGSDESYERVASEVARGLREGGAVKVLLAGKPKEEYSDVDGLLHQGIDLVESLGELLRACGVEVQERR